PSGGVAEFTLPLDFDSGCCHVLWWDDDRATAETAGVMDGLAECAAAAGGVAPADVWITLYVGKRGRVSSAGFASLQEAPLPDAWADCAEARVKEWVLSDPRGRVAKLAVRYNP